MKRGLSLFVVLLGMWLVWSGLFKPMLIGLGIVSCAGVVLLCQRMGIVDRESLPLDLTWATLRYAPWLAVEVVKSNLDLARRVLTPSLPISPEMVEFQSSQTTDLGRVTLANSITLTPSTVTLEATPDGKFLVHSVSREVAEDLRRGEMDRRATRWEGKRDQGEAG